MRKLSVVIAAAWFAFLLLPPVVSAQSRQEGIRLFKEAHQLQKKARSHADLKKAVQKYEQALQIFEKTGFKKGVRSAANNLGNVYKDWGQYEKALSLYEKSLAISRELKDRKGVGLILNNLGNVYKGRGQYDKAVELYEKSLAVRRAVKDKRGEGQTLNNLGNVYAAWGRYDRAVVYYEQSLAIRTALKDKRGEGETLNNLGAVYHHWGQYDKAASLYEKSLSISKDLKDRRGEGRALMNLASVYYYWGQYDKAVSWYEKSLAIKRELKDRKGEGRTLMNLGNVYKHWGQYEKALSFYEKSLSISKDLKDRRSEGNTLNNLGEVHREQGRYSKAVSLYEKSLAVRRALKDKRGESQTLTNLGIVYQNWGQYEKALSFYEKSLSISKDLKDRRGEGRTLMNLGSVYYYWSQYDKAVSLYEKSLAIKRELKDRKGEGNTLNNLGNVYAAWGRYDKAVAYYERSLAIRRTVKDKRGEGQTLNNLGEVHREQGQYLKAVSLYEKSLAIKRELKDRRGEGNTLNNLGNVYKDWGQYAKAVSYYEQSLSISGGLKDRQGEGRAMINLGRIWQYRGQYKEALANFEKGLAVWTAIKVPNRWPKALIADLYMDERDLARAELLLKEANSFSHWARFYLLQGDYPKAREYYQKILKQAEKNRNAASLFTAYTGLGAAYEGAQDDLKALEYYRKAVKFTESLRSSLSPQEREKFFDVRINGFYRTAPYEGLARVLSRMGKQERAFTITEFTKARVFSEGMPSRAGKQSYDVPQEVVTKDGQLLDQLAALNKQRQKAYEKDNKLTINALEPQIKTLEGEFDAHKKMLRQKYPLFAATKYPEPLELTETALKEDEWVLSYDVTDPGVIVYLTKGKTLVKSVFKPVQRKEVDDLVREFREPLELEEKDNLRQKLTKFDFSSAKKLADILLADILTDLPERAPLIVIPDDSLGVLPFEMLVLNEGGSIVTDKKIPCATGAEFFGDRNPISYYQSVTALTLARTFGKRKSVDKKVLVMDDPVFSAEDPRLKQMAKEKKRGLLASLPDKLMSIKTEIGLTFPRLPLTGELGKSLKSLEPNRTDEYNGLKASKPVLFEKPLDSYGSMVFATHGYFGKDLPGIQEPVLVLTLVDQPKDTDGFLRMSEVMGLKLNADVVALTACQTGLGRRISGEGAMSMGRAFQYAGAKTALMSLWSVSEDASVKLVESFFKHLKEGKSKLEALRIARQEIRQAGYDHPFYWAPFILVGEIR